MAMIHVYDSDNAKHYYASATKHFGVNLKSRCTVFDNQLKEKCIFDIDFESGDNVKMNVDSVVVEKKEGKLFPVIYKLTHVKLMALFDDIDSKQ